MFRPTVTCCLSHHFAAIAGVIRQEPISPRRYHRTPAMGRHGAVQTYGVADSFAVWNFWGEMKRWGPVPGTIAPFGCFNHDYHPRRPALLVVKARRKSVGVFTVCSTARLRCLWASTRFIRPGVGSLWLLVSKLLVAFIDCR